MSETLPDECVQIKVENGSDNGTSPPPAEAEIKPIHIAAGVSAIGAGIMLARESGK